MTFFNIFNKSERRSENSILYTSVSLRITEMKIYFHWK